MVYPGIFCAILFFKGLQCLAQILTKKHVKRLNDWSRLERRLEGAHLTPSLTQIFKQTLQGIVSWTGWEVFGVGFFIILGIFLLALMVFGFDGGCSARRAAHENERYGPACQALGLTFTTVQGNGRIVCTGNGRVVSIDPNDLNDTETYIVDTGEVESATMIGVEHESE